MNLLPLVMIILFILGVFSLSQSQRNRSLKTEKLYYVSYFKGLRSVRSQWESNAYKKSLPQGTGKGEREGKSFPFFRDTQVGSPYGQLNLSSLIDNIGKKSSILQDVCTRYLLALYGHTHFFPKDPKPLLEAIVAHFKTNRDSLSLHELELSDPKMHDIFYRILKGTQFYDLKERVGYPPLHLFFTFEASSRPPMNFHAANEIFLEVALGKSLKNRLIQDERTRQKSFSTSSPLSQDEIFSFLQDAPKDGADLFDLAPLPPSKTKPTTHTDNHTFVTVRIK